MRNARVWSLAVAAAAVAGGLTALSTLPAGETGLVPRAAAPGTAPGTTPGATAVPTATPATAPTPTATLTPGIPTRSPRLPAPPATARPPASSPLPVVDPPAPVTTATAPPVQDGRWRHTAKGVTLDVRIAPANPRAGQLVTWTLTMSGGAECCHAQLLYGDNQGGPEGDQYCLGNTRYGRSGDAVVMTFRHAYRRGGTYTPWIGVMGDCSDGPHYFTFKPTLRVAAGPLLSNGPWVPVGRIDDSVPGEGDDPEPDYFVSDVFDHDGAVYSWQWDFGDGTRTPVTRNPDGCHWPKDGGWIEQRGGGLVSHAYAQPGTYTIRFTATTAGCDGKDRQTFTTSMTWTVE